MIYLRIKLESMNNDGDIEDEEEIDQEWVQYLSSILCII